MDEDVPRGRAAAVPSVEHNHAHVPVDCQHIGWNAREQTPSKGSHQSNASPHQDACSHIRPNTTRDVPSSILEALFGGVRHSLSLVPLESLEQASVVLSLDSSIIATVEARSTSGNGRVRWCCWVESRTGGSPSRGRHGQLARETSGANAILPGSTGTTEGSRAGNTLTSASKPRGPLIRCAVMPATGDHARPPPRR